MHPKRQGRILDFSYHILYMLFFLYILYHSFHLSSPQSSQFFFPFITTSLFPCGIFVGSASKVIGITDDFTEVSS